MDVYSTNWNEADASNSTAAPDGWPEGMFPSGVNDAGRAMMGATKRFVDQQIPLVTGGTSTAYTLAYGVAPSQLYDGMTHLVQFNAVNGAAPTLNVNALGAKPLHFWALGGWGAWPANMVAIDQVVRVTYNAAAGTYRAIGMPMVLNQSVSGAATVDFTGIPTTVNSLEILIEGAVGTDNASLLLQVYGTGGALDTGNNYVAWGTVVNSDASSANTNSNSSSFPLTSGVDVTTAWGFQSIVKAVDIQAARQTKFNIQSNWLDTAGILGKLFTAAAIHSVAANITGLRLKMDIGTITANVTVIGR